MAQSPIMAGEEITIQYISFMYGQLKRQKDITACWFFQCTCPRCTDPTELGSLMSAMKCLKCPDGKIVPGDGKDLAKDWVCLSCQEK